MEQQPKPTNWPAIILFILFAWYLQFSITTWRKKMAYEDKQLYACFDHYWEKFDRNWESNCNKLSRGKNCLLPKELSESLFAEYETDKSFCG